MIAAATSTLAPRRDAGELGRSRQRRLVRLPAEGRPRPERAPLAIVMHGYCEYAGYDSMEAFIEHTVRRGSVVIHPRWQTDIAAPCPGPYYIEPCLDSAVAGVRGAMLGDTRAHRSLGRWSDGRRIRPLTIRDDPPVPQPAAKLQSRLCRVPAVIAARGNPPSPGSAFAILPGVPGEQAAGEPQWRGSIE